MNPAIMIPEVWTSTVSQSAFNLIRGGMSSMILFEPLFVNLALVFQNPILHQ